MNTLLGSKFIMTISDGPEGRSISFAPMSTSGATSQPLPECPVPNPNETNKGKQILQQQQYITCRLNSLRQLLQQLQNDMAGMSPDAAAQIRTRLLYPNALLDSIRDVWLYDTRKLISAAGKE